MMYCSVGCRGIAQRITSHIDKIKYTVCQNTICRKAFNTQQMYSRNMYCSTSCSDVGRRKYPVSTITHCQIPSCGKALTETQIGKRYTHCGLKCSGDARRIHCAYIICQIPSCGKPLNKRQLKNRQMYCSRACRAVTQRTFNTKQRYPTIWNAKLREAIRTRDNYTCRECGITQKDRKLSVHHINYTKEDCMPSNLVSLCCSCHQKAHYNRDHWETHFSKKVG